MSCKDSPFSKRKIKLHDRIMKKLLILIAMAAMSFSVLHAQNDRDYVRRGNRLLRDSVNRQKNSDKAIVQYKKAVEYNPSCAIAHYNMGNALLLDGKVQDAMKEYEQAARLEKDSKRLSDVYHNMGVILQSAKQFDKAIECYKQSLRNDPANDETRYNYVLCQRQLKNQQNDNNQNQDKNKDKDQQQQQKQQQQQDKQDKEKEKEKQQQQQQEQEMSRENAEQMLQAAMQREKDTQEKVRRQQQQSRRRQLLKQW